MCDETAELTALIAAARQGDRNALDRLLDRYRPDIRHWIEEQRGNDAAIQADVSDVTQEALLCVARAIGQFHGSSEQEFAAWLKRISLHQLADEIRKNAPQQRGPAHVGWLEESYSNSDKLAETESYRGSTPNEQAARRERLERALAQLPEDQREAVRMHYTQGRPLDELAKQAGITPEEAALRLHRALKALRERLREND